MKEFLVYTGMRLVLFVASLVIITGVWTLVSDDVSPLWVLVLSLVLSGIASWFLLNKQREAFARRVEERASRATAAFEERKAREDTGENG